MNDARAIITFTLIFGLLSLSAYLFMVYEILNKTIKANDQTARKKWLSIVLWSGPFTIFLAISVLFIRVETIYTKINYITCYLSIAMPFLIVINLIEFSRRAPWFWKNRKIFPYDKDKYNK